MDKEMTRLVEAPLANALAVNLPAGRRPASRAGKAKYEGTLAPEKLTAKQVRMRAADAFSAKIVSVLDYYAGTSVPFERIAEHVKLPIEQIRAQMKQRGRQE